MNDVDDNLEKNQGSQIIYSAHQQKVDHVHNQHDYKIDAVYNDLVLWKSGLSGITEKPCDEHDNENAGSHEKPDPDNEFYVS